MPGKVLVTGGSGLIGRHLIPALRLHGYDPVDFDLRPRLGGAPGDVRDANAVRAATADADGIVHLAAVSRVIWGEGDPERCIATNVEGTRNIVAAATGAAKRPWLLFASSREVYGQQQHLPVSEAAQSNPRNRYAQTKIRGEELVAGAAESGHATAIVRFSSVYGDVEDHPDRVVPAFCLAALTGATLTVEGGGSQFDFTAAGDVVAGVMRVVALLGEGKSLAPIHLVSGQATTLRELAATIVLLAGSASHAVEAPPRAYGVERFVGDPARAEKLLGWRATTPLRDGLTALIGAFRQRLPAMPQPRSIMS